MTHQQSLFAGIISGERLYFFYSAETRDEFEGDRDRVLTTADMLWPSVSRLLVP